MRLSQLCSWERALAVDSEAAVLRAPTFARKKDRLHTAL
jgi:hypothetical protein